MATFAETAASDRTYAAEAAAHAVDSSSEGRDIAVAAADRVVGVEKRTDLVAYNRPYVERQRMAAAAVGRVVVHPAVVVVGGSHDLGLVSS